MSLPSDLVNALAIILIYISIYFFNEVIKHWRDSMNRDAREDIFEVGVALIILGGILLGSYGLHKYYIGGLIKESVSARKVMDMRVQQREKSIESLQKLPKE